MENPIGANKFRNLILVFSLAFAVFFVLPALLSGPFDPLPLMSWGDVIDILTPLVLLPLYWLLYLLDRRSRPSVSEGVAFVLLAALWAQGQGMHLAANSIGHLIEDDGSPLHALTTLYDETLSHYLWHAAIMGLSTILILRQWRNPTDSRMSAGLVVGGFLYGFTFFLIVIEGRTALLGLPYSLAVTAAVLVKGRRRLREQPLTTYFLVGSAVAAVFMTIWGLYWRGLPEFSEVGLL